MKIAMMHFRVYETDGVSLEMDKWRLQLEKMGHEVLYISGSQPKNKDIFVDLLDYRSTYNQKIHHNAFEVCDDFENEQALLDYIEIYSNKLHDILTKKIIQNDIDMLIPNNCASLGYNLPLGIALGRLAEQEMVKMIYHHHDFHFERERYSKPTFASIQKILEAYFPYPVGKHCVINKIAQNELYKRSGIKATVVPNVFDFKQPLWVKDAYNQNLRDTFNIKTNDIVFLQATRIVERKAIEIGFEVVKEVEKNLHKYIGKKLYNNQVFNESSKIHFVLAGMNELKEEAFRPLGDLLESSNIAIHYINDVVDHNRHQNGSKIYSLWDVYTMCDFITYTSILEGWGNQLLEGLFAKKPLLVYEYPVYKTDIAQFDFDLTTIDGLLKRDASTRLYSVDEELIKEAASDVLETLFDRQKYTDIVEGNFLKASHNLSYESLRI